MGLLSAVFLGDGDLARTLVVAGAIPLGAWGVFRLTRPLAPNLLPALAAAVAYAVNPLPRNALAQGRLGSLTLYALAPFVLSAMLRASGTGRIGDESVALPPVRRALIACAVLTAVVAAFYPVGACFVVLIAVAFALAIPLAGGMRDAGRVALTALVAFAGAALLLVPWTFSWFDGDGASLGLVVRHVPSLSEVLRFSTGPAGAGIAPWGLLVAGALPLLVATGSRLAWTMRAWMLVVVSYALAWLPGRVDASLPRPEPEGLLVGAALGLAIATGIGVAAFAEDLRRFLFGWRQFAAVVASVAMFLPILGFAVDGIGGRWRMPGRDWAQAVAWMREDRTTGDFRVLWIGDPDVLPVAARGAHDTSYGLSRNGPGDVRDSFAAPAGKGEPVLGDAIGLLANRQTARFGHLIAPMGVRYVAVVRRAAPNGGAERSYDARVQASLGEQLDLAVVNAEPDMMLYENQAWAASRAVAGPRVDVRAPNGDATEAALRAELSGATPVRGDLGRSKVTRAGTFLFADAYDARWQLTRDGRRVPSGRAFGWSNSYAGVAPGTYDLHFDAGIARATWLLLETLWWIAAIVWFVVLRRRDRRAAA
jgi:hypothetical protein